MAPPNELTRNLKFCLETLPSPKPRKSSDMETMRLLLLAKSERLSDHDLTPRKTLHSLAVSKEELPSRRNTSSTSPTRLALLESTKDFLVQEKLADNDFEIEDWILRAE